ncbi:MAG: hypothetical protein ACPIOQ_11745 [Promethearchaeia archaeon]
MGQRVQLSEQGRKSLDEKFHNFSGGRAGTIVAVMAEGMIASVRWDVNPSMEHQYRVGRFGRFELVCRCIVCAHLSTRPLREQYKTDRIVCTCTQIVYDGADSAPATLLQDQQDADRSSRDNSGRAPTVNVRTARHVSDMETAREVESLALSDDSRGESTCLLSSSSLGERADSSSALSFSTDAFNRHLQAQAPEAKVRAPLNVHLQPTFSDPIESGGRGPPSSSLRPSNKTRNWRSQAVPQQPKPAMGQTSASASATSAASLMPSPLPPQSPAQMSDQETREVVKSNACADARAHTHIMLTTASQRRQQRQNQTQARQHQEQTGPPGALPVSITFLVAYRT